MVWGNWCIASFTAAASFYERAGFKDENEIHELVLRPE
jgi:hypothetical protein